MSEPLSADAVKILLGHLDDSQGDMKKDIKEILTQTKKTNGRMTRMEIRHEEEDKHAEEEKEEKAQVKNRLRKVEKWQWKKDGALLATVAIITTGGWFMVKGAMDEYHKDKDAQFRESIMAAVDEKLNGYEFEIIE